jgi:hypothetical protein
LRLQLSARWKSLLELVAHTRPVRRALEGLFRVHGYRLLNRLDQPPGRAQLRTLLGLVHRAQKTRFGRDHDFRRIRTAADFRRLVPVRTPAELCRAYGPPAFPNLAGVTWPERSQAEERPHIFFSPALQAAHRSALRTAFALVGEARPQARLMSGRLLWTAEQLSEMGLRDRLPLALRPYTQPLAPSQHDPAVLAAPDVTCLGGPVEALLSLLEQVKRRHGSTRIEQAWPDLTAILYTRRSSLSSPIARLRAEAGEVLLLEMLLRPEGPVAVEDPRLGGLRLLVDHGVYFEFIPAGGVRSPLGADARPRLGLDEVQPAVPYELVLTSCAGVWACPSGLTVCFERTDPPIIRPVPAAVAPVTVCPAPRSDARAGDHPGRPPRRQSSGTPVALPRSYVHSPWSIPVDRG